MPPRPALLFVPSAVAAAMSAWQLQRMQWKADIVAEAQRNMEQPPVDLLGGPAPEFRRVATRGRYDHARAAFVGPRPLSYEPKDPDVKRGMREMLVTPGALKGGYLLLTPLTSEDKQQTILVNRGWVPPSWKAQWAEHYAAQQPDGLVAVSGVVQGSESPSDFVPANDPGAGAWFWLDVPGVAAACGLPHDTPLLQVLVDEAVHHKGEEPSTGGTVYPLPRPLSRVVHFSTMPIGHLNYAVGWGCMSAAMGYMALGAARKAARRGR